METTPIPAAQYLRKSTDHQQYSLENQTDAIASFALKHNFYIVKTYSDPGKRGLHLRNRPGLKQLLKDVVNEDFQFRAILVFDVSRWGRFQDADEAAHYEYLCKSAGAPVYYCAEMFSHNNSIFDLMMKAQKRFMAGEYSRELSAKVKAGLMRLTRMGYKGGGCPPYGMRRMLLDVHGKPKQLLADGERKSLATERVILVQGPKDEVEVVRRIFHEYAKEHRTLTDIARRLNDEGIPFVHGGKWTTNTVLHALERPQYMGTQVWGRTTAYLSSPAKKVPAEQWALCPNAFDPIVSSDLFERAQKRLANITYRVSNDELLPRLRPVLAKYGKLSHRVIQKSRLCPGAHTYVQRFGGMLNLYSLLGWDTSELLTQATARQRGMIVRRSLIKNFLDYFPGLIEEVRATRRFRASLRLRETGLLISVVIARFRRTRTDQPRWLIDVPPNERKRVAILALMDECNTKIASIRVFPNMNYEQPTALQFAMNSDWFQAGEKLGKVADFLEVLKLVTPFPQPPCVRISQTS